MTWIDRLLRRRRRPVPRPWTYRVRLHNPVAPAPDERQLAVDAGAVVERVLMLRARLPDGIVEIARARTWSIPTLTWLQLALVQATVASQAVADDTAIQGFRKKLHLALDHGR